MPSMRDALLKAAENNPELKAQIDIGDANIQRKQEITARNREKLRQRREAEKNARDAAIAKAQAEEQARQEALEAKRNEERRIGNMKKRIFLYSYRPFGEYSFQVGIIFADKLEEATDIIKQVIDHERSESPSYAQEYLSDEMIRLHVEELPCSNTVVSIVQHIE
ncbi:MAG: hypothetical protein NC131_10025 [Roseburia sp.]|nr:hypothetical protein [Roseburia sp.]